MEPGSFHCIIGISGCGKSTIFRMTNGLLKPKAGTILVEGKSIVGRKHYCGYMPQKDLLFPWRTVGENVALPLEIQGELTRAERRGRAEAALADVGLAGCGSKMPDELSGGMRQRAAFARTMLTGCDLLLLDEPFSALDFLTRISMQEWLLDQWQRHKRTILFITHDVEEALFLSSSVLVVERTPIRELAEIPVPASFPRDRSCLKLPEMVELKEHLIPAMIFLFALLILWQAGAMGLDAAYILPSPTQILAKLWELRDVLFTVHLPATMLVTAIGLGISLVLGLALAVVMDESDLVRKMIYPIVVVSQTIPTTAIAPLFVLWFGYGIWSKVLVTVLITFFPITITVYDGLRSAKTEMAELLETYGATKKDIFLKIKVPCALPYFFSAVKMAVPMSIIGAAIGEWLGAKSGLGYFSRRMMTQLDGAGVFAPIVLLSAAAILAVAVVNLLEKRFVRWRGES